MQGRNIIVIGAGIAGMATAARLAAQGFSVTVLEKNEAAGGKLGLLQQDGYIFDTGPSLFTQPHILKDLFEACGKNLHDYFHYKRPDEGTQYFWEDGTALHTTSDHAQLSREVSGILGTDAQPVLRYLDDAKTLYEKIGKIFLDEPIHKLSTWKPARVFPALKTLKAAYLFRSLHSYNKAALKHPKLVQIFDRFATYNGSDPYQCPAMMSMIAHLELNEGTFYAEGGMHAITQALHRLCLDTGVQFLFEQEAQQIMLEGNTIKGVQTEKELLPATIVVSNSDVFFTYRNLLNDVPSAKRLQKAERSSSGVIFYWGIKKAFEQLRLHNIFFTDDYAAEFDHIFSKKEVFHDPTVYINITSKHDTGHAPEGCENWFVLINAHAGISDNDVAVKHLRASVLQKLSRMLRTDIGSLIATEKVLTPEGIERDTNSYMGALYGTASNDKMAAFARHPNYSTKYHGLYFAGGTVHPGGGIPLCLRSARITAGLIAKSHSH